MGEAVEKLSGKLGIDTTDFKTGISAANRELRVLESGFKANAAALGDWTKDASGLESRIESLTKQLEIQRLKVGALREEYERVKAEKGENSRAAQDLAIKLNKETETLNKMGNELTDTEGALQELADGSQEAGDQAEEAGGKFDGFKSVLSGLGTIVAGALTVVAGLATAVAGVGLAISDLVFDTASASAELVDLSAKTGISTTRLQELAYAGDQVGTSQDTLVSSLARLTRSMGSAQEQQQKFNEDRSKALADGEEFDGQLGDTAAAFQKLGVSITDNQGNLRDNEAVFADLVDALGQVDNEAERDALSMSLFGKSAQELNPLIKAGSEELAKLSQQAHEVGAVMDEDTVASFEAFDDTLASLKAGLQGTLGELAGAFLPGFQGVFDTLGGYLKEFSAIVKGSDGDINKMVEGIGGLVTKIVTNIASQAPELLQTGITILQSIITAIITALPTLIPAAVNIILTLVDFIIQNLPMLIEAGIQALVSLATGIAEALPTLIPAVVEAIITIVNTLVENIPLIIDAALQLILGLAEGLIYALPVLIAALPQIITAILDALMNALPLILAAAGELIGMLATGIVASIPLVLVAIGDLIVRLGDALARFVQRLPEFGKSLVDGIWRGIKDNAGRLWENVKGWLNGLLSNMKALLGISSPSQVLADQIGANMPPGIGEGFENQMPGLKTRLARSMNSLVDTLSVNAPILGGIGSPTFAPAMAGAGGSSIQIGDVYVNASGVTNPQAVGNAVQDGILKALRAVGGA